VREGREQPLNPERQHEPSSGYSFPEGNTSLVRAMVSQKGNMSLLRVMVSGEGA